MRNKTRGLCSLRIGKVVWYVGGVIIIGCQEIFERWYNFLVELWGIIEVEVAVEGEIY